MGMFDQPRGMFAVDDRDTSSLGGVLMDYLRNVMSGQIAAGGVLGQNNYDPNRSFAQNALDPKALEAAMDIGMSLGTGPIRAYHGSPHDFDKFDISKIGTGEGAQAYGHGLYFAEAEGVARDYRNRLGGVDIQIGGQPHISNNLPEELAHIALYDTGDINKAIAKLQEVSRSNNAMPERAAVRWLEENKDKITVSRPGKMYEVNINASPEQFLNNDRMLSQQSPHVQEALSKFDLRLRDPVTGRPAPQYGEPVGREIYDKLSMRMPGDLPSRDSAASATLRNAGIPGIKYLDQGSRGAGQGTSNYVVFDPSIIEILRKYGILGPVAMPGALMPFMGDQQQ